MGPSIYGAACECACRGRACEGSGELIVKGNGVRFGGGIGEAMHTDVVEKVFVNEAEHELGKDDLKRGQGDLPCLHSDRFGH